MDKLFIKEFNFILEPSYSKISKSISNITKELINIVGKQYSNIINERVLRTNFVFFNKIPDINKDIIIIIIFNMLNIFSFTMLK